MTAYYNENDPKTAAWLRELMWEGQIAQGDVDERSIEDVFPRDLAGYTQCHFFAGIGGWSYALRLAGWLDDKPVWTGSCPCQPFSAAGKGKGFADERHLWPAWFHLVRECRPERIFGEQVASNLAWLDLVSGDLEGEGYTVGAAIVGAHSVGAPHIRQRLYWVAHDDDAGRSIQRSAGLLNGERAAQRNDVDRCSTSSELAKSNSSAERGKSRTTHGAQDEIIRGGQPESYGLSVSREILPSELGDDDDAGLEGWSLSTGGRAGERAAWTPSGVVWCRDGKWRPVEPGTFPLAHGIPGRVGLLRGYGNAIVPQVAAAFIKASGLI